MSVLLTQLGPRIAVATATATLAFAMAPPAGAEETETAAAVNPAAGTAPAAVVDPASSTAPAAAPAAADRDLSAELGELAVAENPSVRAIASRVSALEEKVDQADSWLDPTFSAEYSSMPIDAPYPGQHPMSGIQLTVRQTLYWPGKIRAREEAARGWVHQAEVGLAEQKVQLRASVARAYYRLALTRQLRQLTREHVELLGDFVEVVRFRTEAGLGAQHELLQLRVLVDRLKDDLQDFDRDEAALTASINATLHRALDTPIPTPARTAVAAPTRGAAGLAQRAEQDRPLLDGFTAEAEAYQAAARRAAREGYPDVTVWAGYRVRTGAGTDPGTDFVSLGFSVPLPLSYAGRWRTEQRQNEKLADAARQERAAAIDGIRGDLGRAVAEWQRAIGQARNYRETLAPEARLTLDATFAAYQASRADFASLFQAELQLLDFERTTRRAEAAAAVARVDVEALVGRRVE